MTLLPLITSIGARRSAQCFGWLTMTLPTSARFIFTADNMAFGASLFTRVTSALIRLPGASATGRPADIRCRGARHDDYQRGAVIGQSTFSAFDDIDFRAISHERSTHYADAFRMPGHVARRQPVSLLRRAGPARHAVMRRRASSHTQQQDDYGMHHVTTRIADTYLLFIVSPLSTLTAVSPCRR